MSPEVIEAFEAELDPRHPEGGPSGCRVVGYGELTVVVTLESAPGWVLKRMSGFATRAEAERYAAAVEQYVEALGARGVAVVPTSAHVVEGRSPTAYLVQPELAADRLGSALVRTASIEELAECIVTVLDCVARLLGSNRPGDREVAADAQLSNWHFPPSGAEPELVDVGSPLFRLRGGIDACTENIYRAYLWPVGRWLRYRGAAERYFADYFDLRLVVLDLLGNLIKEGAAERIPACLRRVNGWLSSASAVAPVTVEEVRRYYERDAATLELSLRLRRLTRFVRTRLLGGSYDHILPGKIRR